jgi:hypothetical protein
MQFDCEVRHCVRILTDQMRRGHDCAATVSRLIVELPSARIGFAGPEPCGLVSAICLGKFDPHRAMADEASKRSLGGRSVPDSSTGAASVPGPNRN